MLAASVAERRAATDRIAFDIDALLERFAVYAGVSVPGWLPPAEPAPQLRAVPDAGPAGRETAPASPERPSWEQDRWVDEGLGAAAPAWPDVARTDPAAASAPPSTAPSRSASAVGRRHAGRPRRPGPASIPLSYVPPAPAATLTAAFAKAAGVAAATETLNGARERQALSYVGWPPGRLVARLRRAGRAPARKLLAGDPADMAQAQRSDIDNAITAFADEVGGPLPEPWSRTVRAAARSRADEAQSALGAAVAQGLPPRDKVTGWWRLIALAQWLLMALAVAGLVWIALILSPRVAQVVVADQRHLAGALARPSWWSRCCCSAG